MENEEVYRYLFQLQESGRTNMFGAVPYMRRRFPRLTEWTADEILGKWMDNYEEIQKALNINID